MYYFLLTMILSTSIFASGEWWSIPRSEDDKNYYYVGMSEGKDGVSELQDKAFNKAMGELIREHFGMSIQINESAVEELKKQQFQVTTKQSSAPLFIKGVGISKTREKDLDDDAIRVYVQIQADKKSVSEAVKSQTMAPGNDSLNTFGDSHDSKVDISVKTRPQGALIYFTHLDRSFTLQGQGDARFYLPRGRYQMVVSSPGYGTVTKEIEIRAQGLEENILLEELRGIVDLEVYPDEAKIIFEGNKISSGRHKLTVEKIHKFTISHPDYFTQEVEFVIEQPDTVKKEVRLTPKPSTVHYEVYPSGAKIEIDGKEAFSYNGKIQLEPGEKKIVVSSPGYFPFEEDLYVGTNRIYPLKVIKLKVDDQTMSPSDRRGTIRFEVNPFTSMDKVGYGMIGGAIHAEYHYISIGGGASAVRYDYQDDDKVTSTNEKEKKSISDNYLTLRLITPKFGIFKFYAAGVIGQYKRSISDSYNTTLWKEKRDYTGFGGGVRGYITPKWSVQAEYYRLNVTDDETKFKEKQDRFVLGLGYEF